MDSGSLALTPASLALAPMCLNDSNVMLAPNLSLRRLWDGPRYPDSAAIRAKRTFVVLPLGILRIDYVM